MRWNHWQARGDAILAVVAEGNPEAFPQLDPGESTVLTAAMAARAAVLVDERKARSLIEVETDLRQAIRQVCGILGPILLAKRRGRISAVKPLLDDLIRQNSWMSPALYQHVLRQAGEQ